MSGRRETAGNMRNRVRIERPVDVRDLLAGQAPQTELVGHFWAAIESAGTGRDIAGQSRSTLPRYQLTLRLAEEVRPDDAVYWDARHLKVQEVRHQFGGQPLTILLAEEQR